MMMMMMMMIMIKIIIIIIIIKARVFDVSPSGPRTNDPLFIVEAIKEA
jgi:hypothetical protein